MTDFLTRIASRELGVAPVVQPVMGSRYAPTTDLAAPAELPSSTGRTKVTAGLTDNVVANPTSSPAGQAAVDESLPANRSFPPSLNEVETIARPIAAEAQPTDTELKIQTPDAIAEGIETEDRFLGDVRESALTRRRVVTPPGEAAEETSAFTVREQGTRHADFEQAPPVNEVKATTERETMIAERERSAPDSAATAPPESSLDLKSRDDSQGRANRQRRSDLTIVGEPARPLSTAAEFESVDGEAETAELSPSRGEPAIQPRSASQPRSDLPSSPVVGPPDEAAPEQTGNVKTTSPRGREPVVSRPIARRGEDVSQPTNASEPINASEPANPAQPAVEVSASLPQSPSLAPSPSSVLSRTAASVQATASAADVGLEPMTTVRPVSRPARAADSRPTATHRDEALKRTINASSPQLLRDAVSRTPPRAGEDAPSSTTDVRPPAVEVKPRLPPRRATNDSPAIARRRDERDDGDERPEPATNLQPRSQPTSQLRHDVLSSRATGVVNPPTIATPEETRLAANDSSPANNKVQRRAPSTSPIVSEAVDQPPAPDKKPTPDARSLQTRTPPRRDQSPISQSMLMAADRPSRSSRNAPEPRAASEKIIRVTIGRIEVHAAPPPPLPVEPPAPPAPQLSLDEFLRQHNGGRK